MKPLIALSFRNSPLALSQGGQIDLLLSATTASLSLLDWQPVSNEVCNSSRRRRIQVRQHSHHITWPRADLQLAIHPGRATAMAEASRPVHRRLLKSISILTAIRCLDFPRREHLGVLRLE